MTFLIWNQKTLLLTLVTYPTSIPPAMASIPLLRLSLHSSSSKSPAKPHHYHSSLPHPLRTAIRIPSRPRCPPPQQNPSSISMSYTTTPAADRLISAASYFLPFLNGFQYGRYLFMQYPNLAPLLEPVIRLLGVYRSVPYASFVAFFALFLGVVRNPNLSRYVRFNAMQALFLDVILVLPLLIQRILSPGRGGLGFQMMVMGHNAIFLFIVLCFVYSLGCCVLGRTPYLPFIADAAGKQL